MDGLGHFLCSAVATAAFFATAITDLRWRRIGNGAVLTAVAAWAATAALGTPAMTAAAKTTGSVVLAHLATGAAGFVVMLSFYGFGWVGGGDVKLAGAVLLWAGPALAPFALGLTGLCGLVLVAAMLALRPSGRESGGGVPAGGIVAILDAGRGVPYGVPLALAGGAVVIAPWLSVFRG